MENKELSKENLRKFALTIAITLCVLGFIAYLRRKPSSQYLLCVAALINVWAIVLPKTLRLIYIVWMRFAFVLGWINTRLILIIMFYLVFTPIGILMKIFRIDQLELKIDKNKQTYWKAKDNTQINYEKQF